MDLEDFEVVHLHLDLLCLLNFNYYVEIGIHKNVRLRRYPADYSFCDFSDSYF